MSDQNNTQNTPNITDTVTPKRLFKTGATIIEIDDAMAHMDNDTIRDAGNVAKRYPRQINHDHPNLHHDGWVRVSLIASRIIAILLFQNEYHGLLSCRYQLTDQLSPQEKEPVPNHGIYLLPWLPQRQDVICCQVYTR